MPTPLELLQKQNQALHQARAADKHLLKNAAEAIVSLRSENDILRADMAQTQDLLFAILHSIGPNIKIRIDNFRETMQNAQFDGDVALCENGRFLANLTFYPEGKPETETPQNDGE